MSTAVDAPIVEVLARVRAGYRPPPDLKISEFADRELIVTSGPLAGTHWRTDFAPYQRGIMDAFHEPGVQIVVVMGSSQWGKALAIDTPIPTPNGWTVMGALEVGDYVFNERGEPTRVTLATEVRRDRPCFRITFCDGESILADGEHRWLVESTQWADRPRGVSDPRPAARILDTETIARTYRAARGAHRYAIPTTRPLQLPCRDLPVDPYVLGAWLGDGHQRQPCLTVHERDAELVDHLRAAGARIEIARRTATGTWTVRIDARRRRDPCPTCGRGFPLARLSKDGLWARITALGVTSGKRIPPEYLRASEPQRWALLQGLMDTDGTAELGGRRCQFVTTAPGLAETFGELATSLGLKVSRRTIRPSVLYRGTRSIGQVATVFSFTAYAAAPIFRLSRKQGRLVPRDGSVRTVRPSESGRRRIVAVDAVASVPVKCIAVDSPSHLYLAGRGMVPTHNTATAINVVAYHMAHDPCAILVVEPTVDPMGKDLARNRLQPVIDASPALSTVVSKKRAKDESNTTLQKTFRGGSITIGGANSAASLASRTIRLLVLDEVDRYPSELPGEGNPIEIALKRTTTWKRRRRVMITSSPTLVGAPIHAWYLRGDQRRFFVPCPGCGVFQAFEWKQVKWERDDPSTAHLHCVDCERPFSEAERIAALRFGEWRAEAPDRLDRSIVSFHLWEAYSPLSSIPDIVTGFLRAREAQKSGDRATMHTWQNTTLAEPYDPEEGQGIEPAALLLRREAYDPDGAGVELPAGVCCVTMGVDTQDDRLEALVVGWGPGEEAWLIDRHVLPGDTSQPEPWAMLDEVLAHEYKHAYGMALAPQATCIDSRGHRTTMVYDYAEKTAARRVFAIIGMDGQRPIVSSPSPRRWGRKQRQVPLYTVGVDAAKSLIVSRLGVTKAGGDGRADLAYPGYVHIPLADWADDELAAQLTAEKLVRKFERGVPVLYWKKTRPRNEMLDCFVYALAAVRLLNPKYDDLAARLRASSSPDPTPPPRPRAGGWLGPRRSGWLRR